MLEVMGSLYVAGTSKSERMTILVIAQVKTMDSSLS